MIFDRLSRHYHFSSTKNLRQRHTRLILAEIDSLERRDVPAIVSWDGGAGTNLWSDAANWSGDSLPTPQDDVVIAAPSAADSSPSTPSASPIQINSPVVLQSIHSTLPLAISGSTASIRVTSGSSQITAGLELNFAGLAVQGSGTSLVIDGAPQNPAKCMILALDGAGIEWKGVSTLDNMVVMINKGSSVSLPELTTVQNVSEITNQGGTFTAPMLTKFQLSRISTLAGAKVSLPALDDASSSLIEANDAGSTIDLPALTKFDAGRFRADQGATINAPAIKVVNIAPATAWSFSWFVGNDSLISVPQLSYINALPQQSPYESPDARILLRGSGRINFDPAKTTLTNGKLSFDLSGNSLISGSFVLAAQTQLTGSGSITGNVDLFGTFSPSGDYSPYGTFQVGGHWTSRPGSVINLQMGGPSKLDRLQISGQATILGGSLNVSLANEFADDPQLIPDGQFQLISWAGWAGQFVSVPALLPRTDGIQITAQSRYQPGGLVESLARFNTNPDIISVSDMTFPEGNDSISYGTFVVHRSGPMTVPITINYQVIDGSAKTGPDYRFPTGPITLAPGETERQIRFIIRGNTSYGGNKSFQIKLTGVSDRATLGQSLATITIKDDEPAPTPVKPVVVPLPSTARPASNTASNKVIAASKAPAKPAPKAPVKKVPVKLPAQPIVKK
jgi:hypothetical protein